MDRLTATTCGTVASIIAVLLLASLLDKDRGIQSNTWIWTAKRFTLGWFLGKVYLIEVFIAIVAMAVAIWGLTITDGAEGVQRIAILIGPFVGIGALLSTVIGLPLVSRTDKIKAEIEQYKWKINDKQLEAIHNRLETLNLYAYYTLRESHPDIPPPPGVKAFNQEPDTGPPSTESNTTEPAK